MKISDADKCNLKTIAVNFDTSYMEDAFVYEFLTKDVAKSLSGTQFMLSEIIIILLYDEIQIRLGDGRLKYCKMKKKQPEYVEEEL